MMCFSSYLLLSQRIEPVISNDIVTKKIEKARKIIVKSSAKDLHKNLPSAINELNAAMSQAVDYPPVHYYLAHAYWTVGRLEERYENELSSNRKYDNTALVKSFFHFLLYLYFDPLASDTDETQTMIENIDSIYKLQTKQDFGRDYELINSFFANNPIYVYENMGLLCYSLGIEADKNRDCYKAISYFSLSGLFKLPDEKARYSQDRYKILAGALAAEEKWDKHIRNKEMKFKIATWNNTFVDNLYYSYLYQTPVVENSSGLYGVQIIWLENSRFAHYFSIAANLRSAGQNSGDAKPVPIENSQKFSSMYFSAGLTKKIYRPIFVTAGIGIGLVSRSSNYMAHNLSSESEMTDYYAWSLSPEFGITLSNPFPFRPTEPSPFQLCLTAGIKYVFPFKKYEGLSYKNFVYSLGAGLTLPESSKRFYLMYNMEFPRSKNIGFKDDENMKGITVGASDGVYFSLRMNKLFLSDKEKYASLSEKGNLFFTTGYEQSVLSPLHLYAGLGIACQKKRQSSYSSYWRREIINDMELEKNMYINADVGVSLQISYLKFRAGMTIPKFDFNESFFSLGLGVSI
jgi:hypothetical protein